MWKWFGVGSMGISKKVILTSSTEKFKYQARKETGAFVRTHEAGETEERSQKESSSPTPNPKMSSKPPANQVGERHLG
jgi:hypothetical protein